MKKILLFSWFVLSSFVFPEAQQLSNYIFYRENWTLLNPAGLSSDYVINGRNTQMGLSYRNQWVGLEDAPVNLTLRFSKVLEKQRISVGGVLLNDQTGEIGQSGAYVNFAYLIPFGGRTTQTISVGVTTGLVQYRANPGNVSFKNPNDVIAMEGENTKFAPDFGLGIYYNRGQDFYAGISIPQLFGLTTVFGEENNFEIRRARHYYGVVGVYLPVGQGQASYLEPSVWIKYLPYTPLSIDANLRYHFNNWFWIGAGAGSSEVLHFEFGLTLAEYLQLNQGQLRAGFGMDYTWRDYGPNFGNTYEFNVIYAWGK